MANDFHQVFHISAPEEQVWTAFLNNNNLEDATGLDSKGTILLHSDVPFDWEVGGERIVGQMGKIETPGASNTKIVFNWRFDDMKWRSIWPEGHFATTTLLLGDMQETTRIEMYITNIPGEAEEQNRSRHLWDNIINNIGAFLSSKPAPVLEPAA